MIHCNLGLTEHPHARHNPPHVVVPGPEHALIGLIDKWSPSNTAGGASPGLEYVPETCDSSLLSSYVCREERR